MDRLWEEEEDQFDPPPPGEHERCTPELLLAYIQASVKATGHQPTLAEVKAKFGGLLGPMVDYWHLKNKGLV